MKYVLISVAGIAAIGAVYYFSKKSDADIDTSIGQKMIDEANRKKAQASKDLAQLSKYKRESGAKVFFKTYLKEAQ